MRRSRTFRTATFAALMATVVPLFPSGPFSASPAAAQEDIDLPDFSEVIDVPDDPLPPESEASSLGFDESASEPELSPAEQAAQDQQDVQPPTEILVPRPLQRRDGPFNGSFTRSVDIAVPAYHGLEPKLRLTYDSNGGAQAGGLFAGMVGTGWRLDGLPDVVRTTIRGGAPKLRRSDRFLLDGVEVTLCPDGPTTSPSCLPIYDVKDCPADPEGTACAGGIVHHDCPSAASDPTCVREGSYQARYERYERIVYDDHKWIVWSKDGVKSTFERVEDLMASSSFTLPSPNTRWLLSKVEDTHDNVVSYSYQCSDTKFFCVPAAIFYKDYVVRFHFQENPEPLTFAAGGGVIGSDRRLKTIDIAIEAADPSGVSSPVQRTPIRAYALSYAQSPATGLSRLTAIRQYGDNAVINGNGVVTGGTSLLPDSFGYTAGEPVFGEEETRDVPPSYGHDYPDAPATFLIYQNGKPGYVQLHSMKVEHDPGQTDVCTLRPWGKTVDCTHQTGDSVVLVGDFDGDGNTNVLLFGAEKCHNEGCEWTLSRFSPLETVPLEVGCQFPVSVDGNGKITFDAFQFDADGDGALEFHTSEGRVVGCEPRDPPGAALANAKTLKQALAELHMQFSAVSTKPPVSETEAALLGRSLTITGDFNGDGINDLGIFEQSFKIGDPDPTMHILHGAGGGFAMGPTLNIQGSGSIDVADVNGDGKSDIILLSPRRARVMYSTGHSFRPPVTWYFGAPGTSICRSARNHSLYDYYLGLGCVGDVDGDGRADLVVSQALGTNSNWRSSLVLTRSTVTPAETPDGGTSDDDGDGGTSDGGVTPDEGSSGESSSTGTPVHKVIPLGRGRWYIADIDGDGRADLVRKEKYRKITSAFPELMSSAKTPYGARTTIAYTTSSNFVNKRLPHPIRVVTGTNDYDGLTGTLAAKTTFSYRGGDFDFAERKFLGFKTVTVKSPCTEGTGETCPIRVYQYHQSRALAGRVKSIEHYAAEPDQDVEHSHLLKVEREFWEFTDKPPYRATNTASEVELRD